MTDQNCKSRFNLSYQFGDDLRGVFNSPSDVVSAVRELELSARSEQDDSKRARVLGELGALQRMLRDLPCAEVSLIESLRLLESINASRPRVVAAQIRLAHVFQWQTRFAEADVLFKAAVTEATEFDDNGLLLSFALQHFGKSLFDQGNFSEATRCFYQAMMIRVRLKRDDLADSSRFALEKAVARSSPAVNSSEFELILSDSRTPPFVREVIGKRHDNSNLPCKRSNCINAALNFYGGPPYNFITASTLDVLQFLKTQFHEIDLQAKLQFGDAVVYWSRNGGSWDDCAIKVANINTNDQDFPYGLVFEHIAIVMTDDVAFHKPSPALDVPYKFDHLTSIEAGLKYSQGFEVTVHRLRSSST